jgi:quercetin dioxygenase-like cupin family protein
MRTLLIIGAACLIPLAAQAQSADKDSKHSENAIVVPAATEKWGAAPAILPAGAKLAVLEGDPTKPGRYTMRLSMPANYRIPPHFHKTWEHVTVLTGSFNVGMGAKFDEAGGVTLKAGSFGALPPGMQHFAWTTESSVIQLHGEGPWGLVYVNSADDPTRKSK